MVLARAKHHCIAPAFVLTATIGLAGAASAAGPISQDAYERCRTIPEDQARLRCFESLTAEPPQAAPANPQAPPPPPGFEGMPGMSAMPDLPEKSLLGSQPAPSSQSVAGKWRLVHTPNPSEKREVVSIMATAELAESDVDFAGLDVRCAEPDFEILVFLIPPLPPRAQPTVAINGKTFQGSVVSPGTAILLPPTASLLAKEQWRSLPKLAIDVEADGTKTHGLVSLEGFDRALQSLTTACLAR